VALLQSHEVVERFAAQDLREPLSGGIEVRNPRPHPPHCAPVGRPHSIELGGVRGVVIDEYVGGRQAHSTICIDAFRACCVTQELIGFAEISATNARRLPT
jgi:hypothetical protein